MKVPVKLRINDEDYDLTIEPRRVLADVIRDDCHLTGTHVGCAHGVCGACTIIVDGEAVRSCLLFAVQVEGSAIRTVESLGTTRALGMLQSAFTEAHAVQCGFCTPGFLMLVTAAIESGQAMNEMSVRELLASNLCRCTGYENIVHAVMRALEHAAEAVPEHCR